MTLKKIERDSILEHYIATDCLQDLRVQVVTTGFTVNQIVIICAQCNEVLATTKEQI